MKLNKKNGHKLKKFAVTFSATVFMIAGNAYADYPDRAVSWIVPFPPGGPTDVASRILASEFAKVLGQPFVVVNKAGASGSIGLRQIARAKPDGYTIGTLSGPSLLAPLMQNSAPYALLDDVDVVGLAYLTPLILVSNPKVFPEVTDLKSLAALGNNKDLNYTSPATGSIGHLTMELIRKELDFKGTHIGYQGSSPAVTAVLSGEVPIMFADSVAVLQHIKSGSLRALAVSIDGFEDLPDIKSLAQQGVQSMKTASWSGLVAPKGTSNEAVSRLTEVLRQVLQEPATIQRLKAVGAYPKYENQDQLKGRIASDTDVWKQVIKDNNLQSMR